MRWSCLFVLVALSSCSNGDVPTNNTAAAQLAIPDTIDAEAGRYTITRAANLNFDELPSNADLKMVDGDLAKYAVKLCELEYTSNAALTRCQVYVQPDFSGAISGYAVLQQGGDARISTALTTNPAMGGIGCFMDGILENNDFDNPAAKLDISKPFNARLVYLAWQKSPGEWMVGPDDSGNENPNENAATGIWYFEHTGNKRRISRERWSYCFKDSAVQLVEVFTHAITLNGKA